MNTEHIVDEQRMLVDQLIKAEIDTQISTAKQFPRSIKISLDKAISLATLNEEIAQSCFYALPRDGKVVEGPSVRLAEIVASTWGNLRAGARVVANDGRVITAQGVCYDLESNTAITIETRRRITNKYGKTFSEDMQVVTGNAACAIAFRNAVFKVIPSAVIQDLYDKVKKVAKGSLETLTARRTKALNYFHDLKVTDKQICDVLGIQKVEDIDLDKLIILSGMKTALVNNESTLDEMFPIDTQAAKSDAATKNAITLLKQQIIKQP